jgi:predicted RND superfamily exporter protein
LHRLGYFAARAPVVALAIIVVVSVVAGYGAARIETNTSLNALFQSDTEEYRRYERMREAFPLNERDAILVVTAPRPFDTDEIALLRELHLELQLLPEAEGVLWTSCPRGRRSPR